MQWSLAILIMLVTLVTATASRADRGDENDEESKPTHTPTAPTGKAEAAGLAGNVTFSGPNGPLTSEPTALGLGGREGTTAGSPDPTAKELNLVGIKSMRQLHDSLAEVLGPEGKDALGSLQEFLNRPLSADRLQASAPDTKPEERIQNLNAKLMVKLPEETAEAIKNSGGTATQQLIQIREALREQQRERAAKMPPVSAYNPPVSSTTSSRSTAATPDYTSLGFQMKEGLPVVPLGAHSALPPGTPVYVSGYGNQVFSYRNDGAMSPATSPSVGARAPTAALDENDKKVLSIVDKAAGPANGPYYGKGTALSDDDVRILAKSAGLTEVPTSRPVVYQSMALNGSATFLLVRWKEGPAFSVSSDRNRKQKPIFISEPPSR